MAELGNKVSRERKLLIRLHKLDSTFLKLAFRKVSNTDFLGRAVARAPISAFVLLSIRLSQLASREDSRVAFGIKTV